MIVLLIMQCATKPVDNTLQVVPLSDSVYTNIPYLQIVEDSSKLIGIYDNANRFDSQGIELEKEGGFRRWKPGVWDSSKEIRYKKAFWLFEGNVLRLSYQKLLSGKMHDEFDVVAYKGRMFLIPIDQRKSFIRKTKEHQQSEPATDERILSFESLTESYLSKVVHE